MAIATRSARFSDAGSLGQGQGGLLTGLVERFARCRVCRAAVNELADLSDRGLGDLGSHRSTVRELAAKAANQA